jgi:hypothetical protein
VGQLRTVQAQLGASHTGPARLPSEQSELGIIDCTPVHTVQAVLLAAAAVVAAVATALQSTTAVPHVTPSAPQVPVPSHGRRHGVPHGHDEPVPPPILPAARPTTNGASTNIALSCGGCYCLWIR